MLSISGSVKRETGHHGGGSSLSMYNAPPDGTVEFEEFATLALERFSVLQIFENVSTRHIKGSNDWINKLNEELRKTTHLKSTLLTSSSGVDESDLNKDNISHFILRLAFCQTEELKRWFITQELDLFRYKLSRVANDPSVIEKFLSDNDLSYTPISNSEKQSIMESLIEMGTSATQVTSQNYYKIHFLEVLELVKSRRCFLKNGFAYVTISDFATVLIHVYRTRLSKSLTVLSRHIKDIEQDERIAELLRILRERDIGENFADTQSKEHLTADMMDSLSTKAFPLCMRHLHESLKQNHHLRHHGRLQYVLFLKGIGLPMEENLRLMRTEFARGPIPVDKFEKEYAYNIRHSYGKEGKRTSYTPYSCLKIITGNMPGPNDCHGCPFKHFERDFLKQKLRLYGRTEDEAQQILEQSDSNNYQIACQRYFEFAHKTEELVGINHPNQYFEQSMRLANGGATNNNSTQNPNQSMANRSQRYVKVEMTH